MLKKYEDYLSTAKWREKIRQSVRDKAIKQAEIRIMMCERDIADFSADELEIIVAEEERKLYAAVKEKSLFAVLALLGLNLVG